MNYSFKVKAEEDALFPRYFLAVGQGINVFSMVLTCLEDFIRDLGAGGVLVLEVHRLDDLEEVPPITLDLFPGDAGQDPLLLATSTRPDHDR